MHGGDISNREPIIGQSDIYNYIKELNYKDCHAKILLIDSQSTLAEGIVIQVTGELSNDGRPMRRFMQTFVLAPQSEKKYYVLNDIFRYQDQVWLLTSNIVFTSAASEDSSNDAEDEVENLQQQDNGYSEELQCQQEAATAAVTEGLSSGAGVPPPGVGMQSQPVMGEYAPTVAGSHHMQASAAPTLPPGVHAVPSAQPSGMTHPQQQHNGSIGAVQDIAAVASPKQQTAAVAPQQQVYSHMPPSGPAHHQHPVVHHQHTAAPQASVEISVYLCLLVLTTVIEDDSEWGNETANSKWEDPVPTPPRTQQPQQSTRVHNHQQQQQQSRSSASIAPTPKVMEKKEDQAPLSYAAAANSSGMQQQPATQYQPPQTATPVAAPTSVPAPTVPSQQTQYQSRGSEGVAPRQSSHSRDHQGPPPNHHPRGEREHNGGFQKPGRGGRPYRPRPSNYSESGDHITGVDDHTNS
ncbi:hypothetical protein HAZT_HAZT002219, partial [Hyalella azteca]